MMKGFFMGAFVLGNLGAAAQGRVVVNISGLTNNKGVCQACLFTSETSFNGAGQPFRCLTVPVANKEAVAVFEQVPEGVYAVSAFHDENKNQKLDTNLFGIPKEGYGASKNKLPFAAAPAFKDNQFTVSGTGVVNLNIKLRNIGL